MKLLPKVLLVLCLAVVANSYAQEEIVAPSDEEAPVEIPYFIIERVVSNAPTISQRSNPG